MKGMVYLVKNFELYICLENFFLIREVPLTKKMHRVVTSDSCELQPMFSVQPVAMHRRGVFFGSSSV
jgi:hypothetical protein